MKYHYLTVLGDAPRVHKNRPRLLCLCDCGKLVELDRHKVIHGHTKSCGCYKLNKLVARLKTHGLTHSPTYRSWSEMKSRCVNAKNTHFHNYGGRGIKVCERWGAFENFLADMKERPSLDYSIDRIDPNGNYEPSNCRWATWSQQQNNRRNNRKVEHEGRIYSILQLVELTGVPYTTLCRWIFKYKKPLADILPLRPS